MASNSLFDVNNMLINQLVRMDDDNIKPEQLEKEYERSKGFSLVAQAIISNAKQITTAAKLTDDATAERIAHKLLGLHKSSPKQKDNGKLSDTQVSEIKAMLRR